LRRSGKKKKHQKTGKMDTSSNCQKGDLSSCENYSGITLLSTPGKAFNRILLERMRDAVDVGSETIGWASIRQDRSCTDQIATLRIIVEQSMKWNFSLYINFVDFSKAFDSLPRDTMWQLLRQVLRTGSQPN
jgi:hypothetical protein